MFFWQLYDIVTEIDKSYRDQMLDNGECQREPIQLEFNHTIFVDFHRVKITRDAGFLLLHE
jgi:hypothetical protein